MMRVRARSKAEVPPGAPFPGRAPYRALAAPAGARPPAAAHNRGGLELPPAKVGGDRGCLLVLVARNDTPPTPTPPHGHRARSPPPAAHQRGLTSVHKRSSRAIAGPGRPSRGANQARSATNASTSASLRVWLRTTSSARVPLPRMTQPGLSANKLSDKAAIMLADVPANKHAGNHASMFVSKRSGRTTNS
jgi:hypothetical protein